MAAKTITGTWDEICQHESELQGHCLQVNILPENEPMVEPKIPDWIMEYAMKMKNRTPEEIEAVRAKVLRHSPSVKAWPPGKTGEDMWREIKEKYPVEPETEEEARELDRAIEELS